MTDIQQLFQPERPHQKSGNSRTSVSLPPRSGEFQIRSPWSRDLEEVSPSAGVSMLSFLQSLHHPESVGLAPGERETWGLNSAKCFSGHCPGVLSLSLSTSSCR